MLTMHNAGPAVPSVAVLMDDLVSWRVLGLQPTGIQRVASELLDAAVTRRDVRAWPASSVVGWRSGVPRFVRISHESLRWDSQVGKPATRLPLLRLARNVAVQLPLPAAALTLARGVYARLKTRALGGSDAPAFDLLVIPGAFWLGDMVDRVPWLAQSGTPVRVMIYDLFPLTSPQFVVPDLRVEFKRAIDAIIPVADRIVTLGEAPARELLSRYPSAAARLRIAVPAIHAHAPKTTVSPHLLPEPYVLAVSTVEPRKNHRLMLDAWRMCRARTGLGSLVVVGRRGWDTEDIEDEIRQNATNQSLVRIDGATDHDLEALYAGCAASVHASWAEGFGLPVRESVARGIPTLVSSGIPRDGLPMDQIQVFEPNDPVRLSHLMEFAVRNPSPHGPVARGQGTGWEPVVSALLD